MLCADSRFYASHFYSFATHIPPRQAIFITNLEPHAFHSYKAGRLLAKNGQWRSDGAKSHDLISHSRSSQEPLDAPRLRMNVFKPYMDPTNDIMRVTILGSGTSAGVPTLGCRCEVCRSTNPKNKRMRASAYIEYRGSRFLIDCGPDFRTQALANGVEDVDFVLLTHAHADHVGGIDDLRAFNMVHGHSIAIYGTPATLKEIRHRFAYCFQPPPPGGGIPELDLFEINGDFTVRGIPIRPVPVFHGRMPIIGFRFERFAYLTDVSSIPEESFELLDNLDVLVTSALRQRPHPTHMSLDEAVAVAQRVGARQTYFIHMCHSLEHEATNAMLPPHIQLAYDGLVFEVHS
ncbi:hypothetical protein BRCON_2180 [Candidatus Sumerlaea chitinivorans]|uniref:Metallo-beta-lactamase domain-containing protein n=1 Tax=Sumerlaea chitinivorans TaxID=2250252 RepID=A0A2Z4Y6U3_SUMC1|nr:hypothetical protein BRCON_2180 [Candidatus Sumerlaea chitinivorans]